HPDAAAARGKADRIGAEVHHKLVEPFLIAEVCEMHPVALALQGHPRLLGLGVKLLDHTVHEGSEIERLAVEFHEPGAKARQLENLIGKPEQALGALSNDLSKARLTLRQRPGSGP